MTDPNTSALQALAFCANALIEVRDEEGADKPLADLAKQALAYIQAGMILACGRPSKEDTAGMILQQRNQEVVQVGNVSAWTGPNRG